MPHPLRHAALLTLGAALAACDVNEPRPGGSANYSASLGDDPDFSDPSGRVVVKVWFDYGETQLEGHFADGPDLRFHTEAERSGSCRLMTYTPSTCEPACGSDATCVADECRVWPVRQDRGNLLWVWPDGEQTVPPDAVLGYYATATATEAGQVSITTDDGLDLTAPTIGAPEAANNWTAAMSRRGSGDATLRWKDPILHARVRLHMIDCTGTHGGLSAAEIECEGPDTGEIVVPGAFLDALDAGDWSQGECGGHPFERYHAAAPEGDDTARLETVGPASLFYRPDR